MWEIFEWFLDIIVRIIEKDGEIGFGWIGSGLCIIVGLGEESI